MLYSYVALSRPAMERDVTRDRTSTTLPAVDEALNATTRSLQASQTAAPAPTTNPARGLSFKALDRFHPICYGLHPASIDARLEVYSSGRKGAGKPLEEIVHSGWTSLLSGTCFLPRTTPSAGGPHQIRLVGAYIFLLTYFMKFHIISPQTPKDMAPSSNG